MKRTKHFFFSFRFVSLRCVAFRTRIVVRRIFPRHTCDKIPFFPQPFPMIVLSLSWQNGIVLSIKFSSCSSQRHTATKDVQNNGHDLLRRHRDLPDPVLCPRQRESTLAEQADVHEGQPDVVARREVRSVCAEKTPPFSAFPLMFYVCPEPVLANGHVTPSRSKLCV